MTRILVLQKTVVPYIRLWFHFALMFVAGIAVLVWLAKQSRSLNIANARFVSEAVGGALALVAIPIIIVLPWRLIERRLRSTGAPLFLGWLIWLIIVFLLLTGMSVP